MAKLVVGVNDLATVKPELAAEWNYRRNGDLEPTDLTAGSGRKVWWLGACGHEWKATVSNRTNGTGCPYCAGRKVVAGFNDLATLRPDLAAEWNYEKNGGLTPCDVSAGSKRCVWWVCSKGHEWQAVVGRRARGHCLCPACARQRRDPGANDLASANPELAAEWDCEKNGDLGPSDVTAGSHRKVWWHGPCGHEWQASVANRMKGKGCPYCAGRKVLAGVNDLATVNPEVAAEWDYVRNGPLKPTGVTAGCREKVWWVCSKGHEWESEVIERVRGHHGCPVCAGQRADPGVNDLATLRPDLAAEWNAEKNGSLTPRDVSMCSARIVWWRCPVCGFEWQARVANRADGKGCPNYRNHPDRIAKRIARKLGSGLLTSEQLKRLRAAGINLDNLKGDEGDGK